MKRIFTALFFVFFCFCLTGCEVHWNGQSFDVPWFVIAVPVALFSFLCVLISGLAMGRKRYVCPKCNATFRPQRWRIVFAPHIGEEHLLRCPKCKALEMCYLSYNQD